MERLCGLAAGLVCECPSAEDSRLSHLFPHKAVGMSRIRPLSAKPKPEPKVRPKSTNRWPIVGFVLTCVIAAIAVWQFRGAADFFLASRLRGDLADTPTERVPEVLRAALELGQPGQRLVVDSLGSSRAAIADAALFILLDQVDTWQAADAADQALRLRTLADQLAAACPQFDTSSRQRAGRLARQILLSAARGPDNGPLVLSCEQVLRSTMFASATMAAPDRRPTTLRNPAASEPAAAPRSAATSIGAVASERAGSGIDYQPFRPALPKYEPTSPRKTARPAAPGASEQSRSLSWTSSSSDAAPLPVEVAQERLARSLPGASAPPAALPAAAGASEAPKPVGSTSDATSTIDWMRRLHGDAEAERIARKELTSRGFGQLEIELARRLTDDNPDVRRQLAEWLPRLPNIDARPWLLWLSDDPSPRVRLLAATLMSTSSDPALLERVTAMYRDDPDPGVRQRAGERQEQPKR